MKHSFVLAFTLLGATACSPLHSPEVDRQLTDTSRILASVTFDPAARIAVTGRVATLVWPEETSGMLLVDTTGGKRYAFSTARVPDMAKQGFTRFAMHPGEQVTVNGVLAPASANTAPEFAAARADIILKADGTPVFDRAKLPGSGAR